MLFVKNDADQRKRSRTPPQKKSSISVAPRSVPHEVSEDIGQGLRENGAQPQAGMSARLPSLLFRWVWPMLERDHIELDDLWGLPAGYDVCWGDSVLQQGLRAHPTASLAFTLCSCFWRPMAITAICKLGADLIRYVPPVLLSELLVCLSEATTADGQGSDDSHSPVEAYLLAMLLPMCNLVQAILVNMYFWRALRLGILVKSALGAAVCRRALRYRLCEKVDSGRLTNLLASDCTRVNTACGVVNMLWSGPLQLSLALGLLWRALGPSVLGGITVMVSLLFVQACISRRLAILRELTATATDGRLRRTEAAVGARQAVKLQCWETLCIAEVGAARKLEVNALRREAMVKAINVMLVTIAPTAVSLATFTTLVLSGEPLRAPAVFSALTLFNVMRAPLSALPDVFSSMAHAHVALARLQRVLHEQDVPSSPQYIQPGLQRCSAQTSSLSAELAYDTALLFRSASFDWNCQPAGQKEVDDALDLSVSQVGRRPRGSKLSLLESPVTPLLADSGSEPASPTVVESAVPKPAADLPAHAPYALRNISVHLRQGQLLVVLGGMGSGKSTFLAALLGELYQTTGETFCVNGASYCGQQTYLNHGTLRDNVIFGRPFDRKRYQLALESCALAPDLASWPNGDNTDLGDKGVLISGGQQARVALARAVYAGSKLCLLDEPFAALDPRTRAYVWSHALRGALAGSAIVLSTNSPHLATEADIVLVLDSGAAVQCGTPRALAAVPGPFADLIADAEGETASSQTQELQTATSLADQEEEMSNMLAASSLSASSSRSKSEGIHKLPVMALHNMQAAWKSGRGRKARVDISVYRSYIFRFGGSGSVFVVALTMFAAAQLSIVITDCWLARWSSLPAAEQENLAFNLGVLVACAAVAAAIVACQAGSWPLLCFRASSSLHSEGLSCVLHAPMSQVGVLSAGQILSRFSKDLDVVDARLPAMLAQAFTCIAGLASSLIVIVSSAPSAMPMVIIITFAFKRIVGIYRPVAAEGNRLVSVLHAPVVTHLNEILRGRAYIRAFSQQSRVIEHALALLEGGARAQVFSIALQRWLALQLELLGAGMLLCVSLLSVATRQNSSLGMSGLSLTYTMTLTALAKYLVNFGTKADAQFAAVERLHTLTQLQPEETITNSAGKDPPMHWPDRGLLMLKGYQPTAYSAQGCPTLLPLTLTVRPGEHVAIIGRSGAGKSTLLAGLARLLPVGAGSLLLDGWNASEVALSRWRAAIHCIPQQPLLLVGSVAHNLDPDGVASQEDLWQALRLAGLESLIRDLPHGLQTQMHALKGQHMELSGCQQQLLVLARLLLLRKSARLVLLDEPAAGMGQQEDVRLHRVLHAQLSHAATLTITHRLLPLLHLFSRVLVFSEGACVEDGTPDALLSHTDGEFQTLFKEAPARVQAHARRMLALRRSQDIPAVRAILQSFQQGPPGRTSRSRQDAFSNTTRLDPVKEASARAGSQPPPLGDDLVEATSRARSAPPRRASLPW